MVSIIIRTKNEERWIVPCLQAVFNQDFKDFEVIIVDNGSTDKTVEKAKAFKVKVIIDKNEYFPGKALNTGIRASKGTHIICLSAHCLPNRTDWIRRLLENFRDATVAGIYGRQEPMSFSSDMDKRDLLIVFGLDKRVQVKDSFFHNANSMVRRDIWEKMPFNPKVSNVEDRVWAEQVLKAGYKIVYEPEASVYHYHGIHQHQESGVERCVNVVKILEELQKKKSGKPKHAINAEKLNVVAIIPVKGEPHFINGKPLIEYTLKRALESRFIKKVIVSTDNKKMQNLAVSLGAEAPFLRNAAYSTECVDLERVMQYTLQELEARSILPDLVVSLEITFPFREKNLIDDLVFQVVSTGLDTVIPAKEEYNSIWQEGKDGFKIVDEGFIPRKFKSPLYLSCKGLGCVTYPVFLREGNFIGNKVGMYKIKNPYSFIEVRENSDYKFAAPFLKRWMENK